MGSFKHFTNGLIKENPTFRLLLGMCPTLAVTTSAINGLGMGLATTVVLIGSNVVISALRKIIPDKIRIPAFVVIIASFVTIVGMLMKAYVPALDAALGIYIPLIVVNCIILGRAESFASKNGVIDSLLDAIGMGLGYTFAVVVISFFRELIGSGGLSLYNPFDASQVIFQFEFFKDYSISLFTQPAGAFITLGCILAFIQFLRVRKENKAKKAEVK